MMRYCIFIVMAEPATVGASARIDPKEKVDTPVMHWPIGTAHRNNAVKPHQRASDDEVEHVLRREITL
jgi:hypothetical protein